MLGDKHGLSVGQWTANCIELSTKIKTTINQEEFHIVDSFYSWECKENPVRS